MICCNKNHREREREVYYFKYIYLRHRIVLILLQATQLSLCPKRLDLSKGGLSRVPESAIAFPAIEELALGWNQFSNVDNNLKLLHRYIRVLHIYIHTYFFFIYWLT